MDAVMHDLREMLDVDVCGWVPNEAYAETRELARTIKEQVVDGAEADEKERIRDNFPFDDFDEGA